MIQILGILLSIPFWGSSLVYADTKPQSYIDQIKERIDSEKKLPPPQESYSQKLQRELGPASQSSYMDQIKDSEGYQEHLRSRGAWSGKSEEESYTQAEKRKLSPENQESAIQATLEGRSDLRERRKGEVRHAYGLKYGFALKRDFKAASSDSGGASFQSLYENNYGPQFGFFYEHQLHPSETWGSLGLVGQLDFGYFNGTGQLSQPVIQPGTNLPFSSNSKTRFQFFMFPLTVGVNYRLNLLHYLRPFVFVGPTAVGYLETRSDDRASHYGVSLSWLGTAGVSILLNPFDRKSTWDLYLTQGVHRFYLTLEYTRVTALGGSVRFSYSGAFAGLTYEY